MDSIEKLHATVFTLQIKNEEMKKEVERLFREEEQNSEIQLLRRKAELSYERTNQQEQYGRNYNVGYVFSRTRNRGRDSVRRRFWNFFIAN